VQYRVSDAVVLLHAREGGTEHREQKVWCGKLPWTERNGNTYIPFVIICPDVHALSADVLRLEERERRLGRGHLHRYVLVLEGARGGQVRMEDKRTADCFITNLEELIDYEGRLDGRDAACCDEQDVCVPFALVGRCGELSRHVLVPSVV
jgi:hypothetical protein